MNVQQIKDIIRNAENLKIDDLLLAKGSLLVLSNGYEDSLLDTPDWVYNGINTITRQVTSLSEAELEAELRKEEMALEALSTREERREKKQERVALLRKKLGKDKTE